MLILFKETVSLNIEREREKEEGENCDNTVYDIFLTDGIYIMAVESTRPEIENV